MEIADRGFEETGERAVCMECILDEALRAKVSTHLTMPYCDFCERESDDDRAIAVDLEDFMPIIMDTISSFYEKSLDSLYWDDDITRRYSSEEVAYDICDGAVTHGVLDAIIDVLPDEQWNEDPGLLRPDKAMRSAWETFRDKVKHEARFVFLSIPEESSERPDEFTTSEILRKLTEIIERRSIIVSLSAGQRFQRGRLVSDPHKSQDFDASDLGSPPPSIASANRFSPAGISMFYGCDDAETVVAEIGAHSTSRFAMIGEFETTRPLRLANFADLPPIPSVFESNTHDEYYEIKFLRSIAEDMGSPVSIDGSEHIDYVPTQVVTEYLRWLPDLSLDGILFTSAQNGGRCCVVFCGPDGCVDLGNENDETVLRLRPGSVRAVRVISIPTEI